MTDFNLLRFMTKADFMADANCLGSDPNLFFFAENEDTPIGAVKLARAKAICRGCDVQAECLAYALNNREDSGVWGGMSERERRRIRRRRATNARGPIPPPTSSPASITAPSPDTGNTATAAPNHAVLVALPTHSIPSSLRP